MNATLPVIPSVHSADEDFAKLIPDNQEPLGAGSTRTAYAIPGHPDKVLKVINVPGNAPNWIEASIYWTVTEKRYFGEVISVSRSGRYLVMERLDNVSPQEIAGLQVPSWWTDKKTSNFGKSVSGLIKIRDYALIKLRTDDLFTMPSQTENEEMKHFIAVASGILGS